MQQNDRALARWLGPTVVVLAAIAGDEVEGVAAAHRLFQHLVLSRCAVQTSNSGIRYCGHPFRGVFGPNIQIRDASCCCCCPRGRRME